MTININHHIVAAGHTDHVAVKVKSDGTSHIQPLGDGIVFIQCYRAAAIQQVLQVDGFVWRKTVKRTFYQECSTRLIDTTLLCFAININSGS